MCIATLPARPPRTRHTDDDPPTPLDPRDEQLRNSWAATLINHGLDADKLLSGKIRDDKLAVAAEKAGLPERAIIDVLRLFNTTPETLPTPAVCKSRAERTEIMRQRVARREATHHPLDRGGVFELGDRIDGEPEGKLKSPSWVQSERAKRFAEEWKALDEVEAEAAKPVWELDHLDDVPRRMAGLPPREGGA